jgi:hypothetical protein
LGCAATLLVEREDREDLAAVDELALLARRCREELADAEVVAVDELVLT